MCRVVICGIDHPNQSHELGDLITVLDDGQSLGTISGDPNYRRPDGTRKWTAAFPYPFRILDLPGVDKRRIQAYCHQTEWEWTETLAEYDTRKRTRGKGHYGRRYRRTKHLRKHRYDLAALSSATRNDLDRDMHITLSGGEATLEQAVIDRGTGAPIDRNTVIRGR